MTRAANQNWYSLFLVGGMGPLCFRPWLRHDCQVQAGSTAILRTSHAFIWNGLSITIKVAGEENMALAQPSVRRDFLETLADAKVAAEINFDPENTPIYTWFLHHDQYLKCETPRLLVLDRNVGLWEYAIRRLWQDLIDPTDSLEAYVVRPEPHVTQWRPPTQHILISQGNHGPDLRTGLFFHSCGLDQ